MSAGPSADIYTNSEEDNFPGARQRSKPGTGRDEVYDTVIDPTSGRKVSAKPVNSAFLKSKANREAHAARVKEDARRRAARKGNSSSLLWRVILLLFFLPLLSQFTTGSYTFNLSKTYVPRIRKFWQTTPLNIWRPPMKQFTPLQLSRYDGSDPWRPLYLAIDGEVYDVTSNKRVYGKGGSYNFMTGKDASRAFITGCFETHQTHDLRGLSTEQLAALDHWKTFFSNHERYRLIGRVLNPDIDPKSPIPPPCRVEGDEEPSGAGPHGPSPAKAPTESPEVGARVTGEL